MAGLMHLTGVMLIAGSCASSNATDAPAGSQLGGLRQASTRVAPAEVATATTATLAGRCQGTSCPCRDRQERIRPETPPPADGTKRFEFRISADGGTASLDSPTLGAIVGRGDEESCYYIDIPAGSKHTFSFVAAEQKTESGVAPYLRIAEYGPKGPYWYDTLVVACGDRDAHCTRDAADAWRADFSKRKRGRFDPCGSAVITGLNWETSGGQADRDGGLFRDFSVKFNMEVKKFATEFAPGSTECVPK